jgi:TetR/AcrR family transcriptional regulator
VVQATKPRAPSVSASRPSARRRRTRLSATQRKLEILRAAAKVFARSNYRVAATAEIAVEAGVAEPTIYKYFPSKKELFIQILRRIGERILEIWKELAAADAGDGLSTLKCIGRAYLEGLRTHSDDLKIQFQALAESDDPDIARQLRENHKAYVRFFAELIERGQNEGVVRPEANPYATGWFLNGIGFTLTLVQLLRFDHQMGERRTEEMINGYLAWLAGDGKRLPERSGGEQQPGAGIAEP